MFFNLVTQNFIELLLEAKQIVWHKPEMITGLTELLSYPVAIIGYELACSTLKTKYNDTILPPT